MRIEIEFKNNEKENLDITKKHKENVYRIELEENNTNRTRDLVYYLQTIANTFGGILNVPTQKINKIKISDLSFLGYIEKDNVKNKINKDNYGPTNTIMYDINHETIEEHKYMYGEDGVKYNESVFSKTKEKDIQFVKIKYILEKYIDKYILEYDKETKEMKILDKYGREREIESIEGNEWIVFKLLIILLTVDEHLGVFYINCKELEENIIIALITIITLILKERKVIFLYNVGDKKIPSSSIRLPKLN